MKKTYSQRRAAKDSCDRKTQFPTKEAAIPRRASKATAYRCPNCGKWHRGYRWHGSSKPEEPPPIEEQPDE